MECHAKSLKPPVKFCFFAPTTVGSTSWPIFRWRTSSDSMSRGYFSCILLKKSEEDLQSVQQVFFAVRNWELGECGDSGLPVACWDTQLPKGKHSFLGGIQCPRKIHLQQSHLQQPLRHGKMSGGNFWVKIPLVEFNVPPLWFPSLSRIPWFSWRCLKSPGKSKHDLLEEE